MKIKIVLITTCIWLASGVRAETGDPHALGADGLFRTSSQCIACHSNLASADGRDISIGYMWRASMMANSARDPYWQAAVRREVTDHPEAQAFIENKCSTCHMPMAHTVAAAEGEQSEVFGNLAGMRIDQAGHLAADGVSCTVCHQIRPDNFGTEDSFTGGFLIDTETPAEERSIYGPHEVDAGRQHLMQSAAGFVPTSATHMARSELCATCHTLYTESLDDQGNEVGRLAEQVPYLEWLASSFRATRSCQDCHMPVLSEDAPISSVLGQPRPAFSQHVFRGGNAFMLTILKKYRDELGVPALPIELDRTIERTRDFLGSEAATLSIESARRSGGRLDFDIAVRSLTGHKLPTAYPSRRVWLHVTVTDTAGRVLFESGAVRSDGSIAGNANDSDAAQFEPHYAEITRADQVQIYEPILGDWQGRVTTGLIYAEHYLKDNRLLPAGFDKQAAGEDIAVAGGAREDEDFAGGGDRVRYRLDIDSGEDLRVRAELLYQSIGYRWARNLDSYATAESERFGRYYRETIANSAVALASDSVAID